MAHGSHRALCYPPNPTMRGHDMRVWALWHGGSSYVMGSVPEDVEVFASISAAREAFTDRYANGYGWFQHFEYVNREPVDVLTPAVEDGPSMMLWLYDPSEDTDP